MKKIFIVAVLCLLLTGCTESKEEIELKKQYRIQASENAINYIKEKYGFTANVEKIELLERKDTSAIPRGGTPIGISELEMSYQNKSFLVRIDCDKITTIGYDNYQRDLIDNSILNRIEDVLGKKPEKLKTYYDDMINKFFDGNNLNNVIENNTLSIYIAYNNYDLSNYKEVNLNTELNLEFMEVYVYNFRSLDALNNYFFPSSRTINHSTSSYNLSEDKRYKETLIIKEIIYNDGDSQQYYDTNYNVKKYDNFYYLPIGGTVNNIYECTIDDLEEKFNNYGYNINNYITYSKTYCIEGDFDAVGLYYPIGEYVDSRLVLDFPNREYSKFFVTFGPKTNDMNGTKYVYGMIQNFKYKKDEIFKFALFERKQYSK